MSQVNINNPSDPLTEHRLSKVEEAVATLAGAVDELKTFAVQMKTHAKWGLALITLTIGVFQPVVSNYVEGKF